MNTLVSPISNDTNRISAKCSICGGNFSDAKIDLPSYPLTEMLFPAPTSRQNEWVCDQAILFCESCQHAQMKTIIPPEKLYDSSYSFLSSTSNANKAGMAEFIQFIQKETLGKTFDKIIEVGCNNLYLLNQLSKSAPECIGIDPMLESIEDLSPKRNVRCIPQFMEDVDFKELMEGERCLILSSHNVEHIENPNSFMAKVMEYASEDSMFIFQFPCLDKTLDNRRFDHVFHHHYHYYSAYSFEKLINRHGAYLKNYEFNERHWESLLISFSKEKTSHHTQEATIDGKRYLDAYKSFKQSYNLISKEIIKHKKDFCLYGAVLTLPVIVYHLEECYEYCLGIIDDSPAKHQLYYPSLTLPIQNSDKSSFKNEETCFMISALNNVRDILPQLHQRKVKEIIILNPFV